MKIALQLIILFFFSLTSYSQNCESFHLKCNPSNDEEWSINPFSSSYLLIPGEEIELDFELLKGKDYRISLCGDDFVGNIFDFKILDKLGNIMYDNTKDNYALSFSFSCLQTKKIIFKINLPETGSKSKGCLGVLVEETISVSTGF